MATIETAGMLEEGTTVQVLVTEVDDDGRSGLHVEVYPEGVGPTTGEPLESATRLYIDDRVKKSPNATRLDAIQVELLVESPDDLYAKVSPEEYNYYVEVGEVEPSGLDRPLFWGDFNYGDLDLVEVESVSEEL